MKEWIPKNWRDYVIWLCLTALVGAGIFIGCLPRDTPLPPPPIPVFEPTEAQANGWQKDEEAVKAVQSTLVFKAFSDTPAGQGLGDLPEQIHLWDAYHKLFARGPPSKNQANIGSCVSFGTNTAVAYTLAVQIVQTGGDKDQFRDIAEEVTYGGSRVQVGKGRIRGDGSVGAWAAQFVKDWGVVSREKHGQYDLSSYSVPLCRTFGDRGVPIELQAVAREHPIRDITLVKTWDAAKRSLASGYAIAICSDQGFSMKRDENGICRPSGSWAHCMALIGYATINGKEYGRIENSWGADAHTGPVGPGNPPPSGFYADASVIARMLGQGDSWAFSAVKGWPSRKLDWDIFGLAAPARNIFAMRKEVGYAMVP